MAPDIPPDLEWAVPSSRGTSLRGWRGHPVLLDFWTRSCVNCRHVAAEIDQLTQQFGDAVEVIAVHGPKFRAEADLPTVREGARQLALTHPIVNDPDFRLWRLYGLQSWPSVVLIGPEGEMVATAVGESEVSNLALHLRRLGTSERVSVKPDAAARPPVERNELRHPNRVLAVDRGWLISEQRGDVVWIDADGSVLRRFSGFGDPGGMCHLENGEVAVADSGLHQAIALDLATGNKRVLAGSGNRARRRAKSGARSLDTELSSPHDVVMWRGDLVIALAGQHQLIAVPEANPAAPLQVLCGTSAEGLKDGPAPRARLAMPTAMLADGNRLWFTDADSSALRYLEDDRIETAIGLSPISSGHRDGPAPEALLQHPAGLALDPHGRILMADVFNGAIRRYDPESQLVTTVATDLAEPTDLALDETSDGEPDDEKIFVVERSASKASHIEQRPSTIDKGAHELLLPSTVVEADLRLDFVGVGHIQLEVTSEPTTAIVSKEDEGRSVHLVLHPDVRHAVISVVGHRTQCEEVCSVLRQTWRLPLEIQDGGSEVIPLIGR